MEISITPDNVIAFIIGFGLVFGACYFCAWLLLRANWFVKILGVYGTLNAYILVSDNGTYTFFTAFFLAFIIAFRGVIIKLFQSFFEWFLIIKDYLDAFIRVLLYPFIYAYRYIAVNREAVRDYKQSRQSDREEDYKTAWEDVSRAKAEANRSQQTSDEARRKAEREKEYYKEQARKARAEANKQQEKKESQENNQNSSRESNNKTVDNRTPEQILGLQTGFSKADLKKTYRSLSGRYHPDKYEHMSDNFKEEAKIEFQKVQEAYNKLLKIF